MKTLSELQERSKTALQYEELVGFAQKLSPTSAYDAAKAEQYSDALAQSCRFLAMLRRDCGDEAFTQTIDHAKDEAVNDRFENCIVPALELLEQMLGGSLRIVKPRDRGLTLVQYLRENQPTFLNLGLMIGEHQATLKWTLEEHFLAEFVITDGNGKVIAQKKCQYLVTSSERSALTDHRELRRWLYDFLLLSLAVRGASDSVMLQLIKWQIGNGELILPRSHQIPCLRALVDEGKTQEAETLIGETRALYAHSPDLKPWAFEIFDREAQSWLAEARHTERIRDSSISLVDKLHQGLFWAGLKTVPGKVAARTFTFLVAIEWYENTEKLVRELETLGYQGSTVVPVFSVPDSFNLVLTNQIDAIMAWDDPVRLQDLQRHREKRGMVALPQFNLDWLETVRFTDFLASDFPLS